MFSYTSDLGFILVLKNRLIVTVILSTHNICFGLEMRQLITWYPLITKALIHAIVN